MIKSSWNLLSTVYTVENLMTPRDQLVTFEVKDGELPLLDETQPYDVIPVVRDKRIIGVIEKGIPQVQTLSDRWLITRDTNIPDLLTLFVETRQKAFLVLYCHDVIGLVTPADLNKLPSRAYVYNLIGELEMGLADLIHIEYGQGVSDFLKLLSKDRRSDLDALQANMSEGNADVDPLQSLYLSDLITIVEKDVRLRARLGLSSRNAAEKIFSGINDLRKQTMHLVCPLLVKVPDDLLTLQNRMERSMAILEKLGNI
jgi:hypothetical protein